jgi:hypothetical protein
MQIKRIREWKQRPRRHDIRRARAENSLMRINSPSSPSAVESLEPARLGSGAPRAKRNIPPIRISGNDKDRTS